MKTPDVQPRDVLVRVVARSPGAGEAAHRERFRKAILADPQLMAELADRYFRGQYRAVLRQRRPKAELEAERCATDARVKAETEVFMSRLDERLRRRVHASLAGLPLANGKRFADCSPEELATLAAANFTDEATTENPSSRHSAPNRG